VPLRRAVDLAEEVAAEGFRVEPPVGDDADGDEPGQREEPEEKEPRPGLRAADRVGQLEQREPEERAARDEKDDGALDQDAAGERRPEQRVRPAEAELGRPVERADERALARGR
jgi:hypothetical protein